MIIIVHTHTLNDASIHQFESGDDIYYDELPGPLPEGKWRLGKPCAQSDLVLMRIASTTDEATARDGKEGGGGAIVDPVRDRELKEINMRLSEYIPRYLHAKWKWAL